MTFLHFPRVPAKPLADKLDVSLSDETTFSHQGTLDFIDNAAPTGRAAPSMPHFTVPTVTCC